MKTGKDEPTPKKTMAGTLRVMLLDNDPARVAVLERALLDAGHEVIVRDLGQISLLESVTDTKPDVIIVDIDSPDRDTLEDMSAINRHFPRPIVMFAAHGDEKTIETAIKAGVSAYVVDGLSESRVMPVINVAIARFREYQALRDELEKTRNTLAERKVIDRAKGLLMKRRGCTEEEAYHVLRKMAMNKNLRLVEVARNVVDVMDLLG